MDGEDRQQLLADFLDTGTVGGLHGDQDELVKLVLVDRLVVHPVGGPKDGIGDTGTNFGGDGDCRTFFGPNDGLSHLIDAVGGVHCISLCDNGGGSVGLVPSPATLALSKEALMMMAMVATPIDLMVEFLLGLVVLVLLRSSISMPHPGPARL